jgi:hypothetical protein
MNKQARMSSVNRAIELCARNNVRVDGHPRLRRDREVDHRGPLATIRRSPIPGSSTS